MYQRGCGAELSHFGHQEHTEPTLRENGDSQAYEGAAKHVTAFRFMGSTVLWLDLVDSITTGTVPRLSSKYSTLLGAESPNQVEDVMGCQNLVLMQLGRISILHGTASGALQLHGNRTIKDLHGVNGTRRDIENVLAEMSKKAFTVHTVGETGFHRAAPTDVAIMTRVYTYMASVYLHLVVYGFHDLYVLNTTMSNALDVLKSQASRHLLTGLVAPLYLIGCTARVGKDQDFFREVFCSPPVLDPHLEHRQRIYTALQAIWARREIVVSMSWGDAVELSKDILLV
jgi:hypothetical protein